METDDLGRIARSRRMKYVAITVVAVAMVLAAVALWWWYSLPLLRDRRSFNAHFYDSKVRELYDLLAAVQGGCDAVQSD